MHTAKVKETETQASVQYTLEHPERGRVYMFLSLLLQGYFEEMVFFLITSRPMFQN